MHRLLGISHFYLYNQNSTKNLNCVLKEYASKGITVLDWNWDCDSYKSEVDIRINNIFAALNDCLYRGMYKHKYLAFFDIDEFLFPKKHKNLIDLMKEVEKNEANMASLTFRNAFFYLKWPDDPDAKESQLITVKKTRRKIDLNSSGDRSKYICKPEEVLEVGNHFVWEARTSQMKQLHLDPEQGFLHHYRAECESGGMSCLNLESIVDKSTGKWQRALKRSMSTVQTNLGKKCELSPIII
jgi:hypothetical protein